MSSIQHMREVIRAAKVGDTLIVREGGQPQRRYSVVEIEGIRSRVLRLVGVAGAERFLIDGVHTVWLRRGEKDARRVSAVDFDAPPRVVSANGEREAASRPHAPMQAHSLARLVASRSTVDVAAWVVDRLVPSALHDPHAAETVKALQCFIHTRQSMPGLESAQ